MAGGPAKPALRWGSLLSQAVAGVEARLDNILADEESSSSAKQQHKDQQPSSTSSSSPKPASVTGAPSSGRSSPGPSRTASTTRANDRLQERLARAMAAKSAQKQQQQQQSEQPPRSSNSAQASPRQSIDTQPPRTSMSSEAAAPIERERTGSASASVSASATASPRASQDVVRSSQDLGRKSQDSNAAGGVRVVGGQLVEGQGEVSVGEDERNGTEGNGGKMGEDGGDGGREEEEEEEEEGEGGSDNQPSAAVGAGTEQHRVQELEQALEEAQARHQEETHGYVERIEALESRLQFLAREATDAARKSALAAAAGSAEKKLAEKDQQIAQLVEEGTTLASTEQKHRTIIKKLRAKTAEDEKELEALRTGRDKADRELAQLAQLRKRARRADELGRARDGLAAKWDQAQRDLASKDATIADLRAQLQQAADQAQAMAAKAASADRPREQDRRRIAELEESVAALQVEKNLVADRGKMQANDLREQAQRANERVRTLELEIKAETQTMETKLEIMRVRAEEASSGATGDSQAKLLRQIETLQTQYAIASENWQGIETTLLARMASLERERDEAMQRETEMRKKAREASLRAKRNEEELEEARTRLPGAQDLEHYKSQLASLKKRADEAEAALAEARAEFERQREAWEEANREDKEDRDDDKDAKLMWRPPSRTPTDRRGWFEDLPGAGSAPFRSESRPETPLLPMAMPPPQRTMSSDMLGLQSLASKFRKASATPSSNSDAGGVIIGGSGSRRPSALPPAARSPVPGSLSILSMSPTLEAALPTPLSGTHHNTSSNSNNNNNNSSHPLLRDRDRDRDDPLESAETSSSPQQLLQDMVSVSTVAAGPSVQLVERMSAAIRRLQSEKVAAREELARIARQRDEARAEIVALMRDVEAAGQAARRAAELEAEAAEVRERYETTLEMLGEKSELVEELRADVQDVKAMYRELVERTVK